MLLIDLQLGDDQAARLERFARSANMTRDEASAQLIEEALRHVEFPMVEFRDSPSGRQAYVVGSRLAVSEMVWIARSYDMDSTKTAEHLAWPVSRVEGTLAYARAYREEIERGVSENDAVTETDVRHRLSNARWID